MDAYDRFISAEIPDKGTHPAAYKNHNQEHGSWPMWSTQLEVAVCDYPKAFRNVTLDGNNGYPINHRR
ncbi:hypothetical protein BC939DRAFT_465629, partial [Gamsiella multidivaricata]|uniref:uncharacterized protein n=1 Tax=Gamsiella multidivaricata TaxID=101098 RepID=UPI00221F02F8